MARSYPCMCLFLVLTLLSACWLAGLGFAQQSRTNSSGQESVRSVAHRPDLLLQSGHSGPIQALAFSADGQWLASGGYDKTVVLWNAATGEQIARFSGHTAAVIHVAFSPDGNQLASTSFNGNIRVWDIGKRRLLYSVNLRGTARHLQFTPDGKLWAATVDAKDEYGKARIELREAATGKVVQTIPTDWASVTAMRITSDGRIFGAGLLEDEDSSPGSVHIWNLASGQIEKSYSVSADTFSPDGRWMGWIDYVKRRAVILDVATGSEKQGLPLKNEQAIYFSPDGQQLAITDPMSRTLKLLSVATGEVRTITAETSPGDTGLTAVAFSADGKALAAAPYADYSIKIWDLASAHERQTMYGQAMVQGMVLSRDGSKLIAGSPHGIDFWDLVAGKRSNVAAVGYVNAFAVSSDGRWLAINPGSRFAGEKLAVWDMKSQRIAAEFSFDKGRGSPVSSVAFVVNDSPLKELGPLSRSFEFTADDGKHTIWSSPSPVASSPDGKIMAIQAGMGGTLVIWDMSSGQKLATIEAHKVGVASVAFSADGRSVLTVGQETQTRISGHPTPQYSADMGVKVWDVATWKPRITLVFSPVGAPCAAFSPDGRRVALERAWDRVEILDAQNGASLELLTATDLNPNYHQFARNNVIFSSDGARLFQGAQNGIRMWKLSPLPQ